MILNSILGRRYFRLMDQLSAYAHERLHVVDDDEFWTGEPPRGIGERGQRETIRELWESRGIIDDYVRDNPNAIGQADLDVIASWKSAYTDTFYVDRAPDGTLYFFAGDYLFDVCGMSLDIATSLSKIPAVVQTTLIPYAGRVVYDMSLWEMSVVIDGKMHEAFAREFGEAHRAGRIIRTSDEFLATVSQLEDKRVAAAMEDFRHQMELEEQAKEPGYGQHRGVLAGLSDEEREAAIRRRGDELNLASETFREAIAATLDAWVTDAPLTTSLVELLRLGPTPSEEEFVARLVGTDSTAAPGFDEIASTMTSAEFQEAVDEFNQARDELAGIVRARGVPTVMAELLTDPAGLQQDFEMETSRETQALRRLADAGGRMTLRTDEITSLADLPHPADGLCYYFRVGNGIEVIMPDEVVPLVQGLDWEAIALEQESYERLVRFVDNVAELRGIARYEEVLAEYLAAYPETAASSDDLDKVITSAMASDDCVSCILDADDDSYLLHYDLAAAWYDDQGTSLRDEGPFIEGPLGGLLESLLAQHQGKEPRTPTAEMMEHRDLYAWKETQLPVRLLRDYLDANVPDERDDCFFADRALEELIQEAMWGLAKGSVERFFDILDANDFVPSEAQVPQLLTLWQNLCNALPCWPNNGWSPNEIFSRSIGRKVFYNPDGSIMRVGRNDPCPCGSGKKYKRCHGR